VWKKLFNPAHWVLPKFTDTTFLRDAVIDAMSKKNICARSFAILSNTDAELVLCPSHCTRFIDDHLKHIPMCDYFNVKLDRFTYFKSSGSSLAAMKPNFPYIENNTDLNCTARPSIYFDKKLGLCLLACGSDRHEMNKHQVHVPDPKLQDMTVRMNPRWAPVSMSVNIKRGANISKANNVSAPSVNLDISANGASTFCLHRTLNEGRTNGADPNFTMPYGLLAKANPIIQASMASKREPWENPIPEFAEHFDRELPKFFKDKPGLSYQEYEDSVLRAGTFIPVEMAAFHLEAHGTHMGANEKTSSGLSDGGTDQINSLENENTGPIIILEK
jgi:hypothetical protein